jgi:hypothetical protein
LNGEQKSGVEESVHHCLIHNTLLHPPKIAIEVSTAEMAAPVQPV